MAEKSKLAIYKPKIEDFKLKILVYGQPGVGKTTLAASAQAVEALSPVLLVNVEGGTLAIADPSVYGAKEVPDVLDFTSFAVFEDLKEYLYTEGVKKYKTVIIDSLSEMAKMNLDHVVDIKSSSRGKSQDPDDVYLEDYGNMTKKMRRVVRAFRDAPFNVIMTAHDAKVDAQDKASDIGPNFSAGLRKSIEGYVDMILYMYTKLDEESGKLERNILSAPGTKWTAKDRSPGQRLQSVMVDPTMKKILSLVQGKEAK